MAKFVKLESGAIINLAQIVAIKYDNINECQAIYTTAIQNSCLGDNIMNLRFKATKKDVDNILKASKETE